MPWNFDKSTPIYLQIANEIRKRIVCGVYPIGSQLPSVRDLAMEASVNPNTMQRALTALEGDGILEARSTQGRFVTDDRDAIAGAKREIARSVISGYLYEMKSLGFSENDAVRMISDHIAVNNERNEFDNDK